jgi:hypothetical protein
VRHFERVCVVVVVWFGCGIAILARRLYFAGLR